MLRFILKRKVLDRYSGADFASFETLDVDVPALEKVLRRGGLSQEAHDFTDLVGVEVLAAATEEPKHG